MNKSSKTHKAMANEDVNREEADDRSDRKKEKSNTSGSEVTSRKRTSIVAGKRRAGASRFTSESDSQCEDELVDEVVEVTPKQKGAENKVLLKLAAQVKVQYEHIIQRIDTIETKIDKHLKCLSKASNVGSDEEGGIFCVPLPVTSLEDFDRLEEELQHSPQKRQDMVGKHCFSWCA